MKPIPNAGRLYSAMARVGSATGSAARGGSAARAGRSTAARSYPAARMLTIPPAPARLRLPIERLWNGAPCDVAVRAAAWLSLRGDALEVRAELRQPGPPRVPEARPGTRVDRLWEFDVVECFLAGSGGRYLEIDRPHRLVFTLAADADSAGDVVTVEIVRDGRGCTLTLTHMLAAEWAQYADRTESGWADVLAALAAQLH